ncbi:TPA_asm: RNA-directed RNA polymerase [ssRNA phage SRR6960799_16]|uniref:RNA-directed RNA polymerase n=1 Tax=ssRNA phage SRR6960799_16 TaxID=2786572 RepID=A0A8S5L3M9_9VIRU|nr:RNA-directed RNA polymerase [ssRNA phage SRR6960799_16]DAD52273.1 TPA_asm: RNA-directed RNA polymerase [ssRNA phage SRR6960799_16]
MWRKPKFSNSDILKANRAYRLHPADNRRVVQSFYSSLDTPVSLSCFLLYKYEEYDQLVSKEVDPRNYMDPASFRDDFAAISFMRKNASVKTSFDRKQAALDTFKGGEESCKLTNERVRSYLQGRLKIGSGEAYLNSMIRKIERILGRFDVDTVLDTCNWGPGVTLSVKGDDTSGSHKFDIDRDITKDAHALYGELLSRAYPTWLGNDTEWNFREGNKVLTVPKNAKTDRTIAVEPGLNSWIQLGIGKLIRKRLRSASFDLNTDLKNQRGAYLGSINDLLATVDFKAASDTISTEVVRLLLPPTWFSALDAARSKIYNLSGTKHWSEKFSTMGNGFTFELESLIFVSLALAICEVMGVDDSNVSVFGDDLILPSECVEELTVMCAFLGFTVNAQKSYSRGPFRESCGCYFFNGIDVKPLFNKKDLVYVKDVFRMANAIRLLAARHDSCGGCDRRFRRCWSLLTHLLPEPLRLFGERSGGDACIHSNFDECNPRKLDHGHEGFYYSGLVSIPISIHKDSLGLLLSRLKLMSRDGEYNNLVSLRSRTRIVFKRTLRVARWCDFGSWR